MRESHRIIEGRRQIHIDPDLIWFAAYVLALIGIVAWLNYAR